MCRVDKLWIYAPPQLPLAPLPVSTELLSSWLLRVAAANSISLWELFCGMESRYGAVLTNYPIDYDIPEAVIGVLSEFCRVNPNAIRMLDLRHRIQRFTPTLLLGYEHLGLTQSPRDHRRPRYTFCSACVAIQPTIHVHWEWSLSCLSRCPVHRRPLVEGCQRCGEADPLTFTKPKPFAGATCRTCGADLAGSGKTGPGGSLEVDIQAVEDDYRGALHGRAPVLLPRTGAAAFRAFYEEMLPFLTRNLNRWSRGSADTFSREELIAVIARLVLDARPNLSSMGRRRSARRLRLWEALFSVIAEHEGAVLERTHIRWPVPLRQRFLSALCRRKRRRSPYTPYRPLSYFDTAVKRSDIAPHLGLAAE